MDIAISDIDLAKNSCSPAGLDTLEVFCGAGRAGAPSGIYQRTGALHCGDGGPLFRSPSGPPFSAHGHGGATSINACFGRCRLFFALAIE
jgi:hypothetical protein